ASVNASHRNAIARAAPKTRGCESNEGLAEVARSITTAGATDAACDRSAIALARRSERREYAWLPASRSRRSEATDRLGMRLAVRCWVRSAMTASNVASCARSLAYAASALFLSSKAATYD